MSGQKDQPSVNLLFSPTNNLFSSNGTSALLMPVDDTTGSALMTSENIAEEGNFLGQNETDNPAVFSLFSGSDNTDPFASVGGTLQTSAVVSSEQSPSLFVPATNTSHSYVETSSHVTPSPSASTNIPGPPQGFPSVQNYSSMTTTPVRSLPHARYVAPNYTSSPAMPPVSQPGFGPPPTHPPQNFPITPPSLNKIAGSVPPPPTAQSMYLPVSSHWCYCKTLSDGTILWKPFSYYDSEKLDAALLRPNASQIVATEGGRYDVDVADRSRNSIYWEETPTAVRRCTWFGKGDADHNYEPFDEDIASMLENEYRAVVASNSWHKQIDLASGEMVVIHNPQVIVHLVPRKERDQFGSIPEQAMATRIVKRGISDIDLGKEIPENEIGAPDHVVFVCHGIGPVCDLRSRTIVECVDDFRSIHLSLLKSHFKKALECKEVRRIEFIPVHWHRALHGNATGVDRDIKRLTLPSIQRLRHFTNETLLDILFYSSPVYCQTISETIGSEINSLYRLFLERRPDFGGKFSVAGHSLGSLMLFDLLCNQRHDSGGIQASVKQQPPVSTPDAIHSIVETPLQISTNTPGSQSEDTELSLEDVLARLNLISFKEKFEAEQIEMESLLLCTEDDLKVLGLPMGPRKKLVGYLKNYQEEKDRKKEQKIPEPTMVQEINTSNVSDQHEMDSFSTLTSGAMNVHVDFQQFDSGTGQPMVIYPRLLFEPSIFFALGSPIGMFLTVRGLSDLGEDFRLPTCEKFFNVFHPYDPVAYRVEPLINPEISLKPVQVPHYKGRKRLHLELRDSLERMGSELKHGIINSVKKAMESMQKFASSHWQAGAKSEADVEEEVLKVADNLLKEHERQANDMDDTSSVASESSQATSIMLGKLNGGRRIDYVLQERPLESFNDYLFAFQSHLCYWNSEDTVLLMIKEIYNNMDVKADSQLVTQAPNMHPPASAVVGGPPMMVYEPQAH